MKDKIRVAIVGCGTQAQLANIPAVKKNKNAELVAISDIDEHKLELLASKYGIPKRYREDEALFKDPAIDVVMITTPNYLHSPLAIAALEYNKDVLCDMPMALTAQDGKEMVATAKRKHRRLGVSVSSRFRPDIQLINDFVKRDELGEINYAKAGWLRGRQGWTLTGWRKDRLSAGGGAFLSLGVHILGFAIWLLGNTKPLSILGTVYRRDPSSEVEDTAFAFMRFERDVALTVEVGWSLLMERDLTYFNIFGKKGAAIINPLQIHKEMHGHLVNVTPAIEGKETKDFWRVASQHQVDSFIDSIVRNEEPIFKGEDGLLICHITDAFYQSVALKKEVKIET